MAAILVVTAALLGAVVWLEIAINGTSRPELFDTDLEAAPLFATLASASSVGAVLAIRRPSHPVGWLFLALGAVVALSGAVEGYALYGAVARPGSLPAAELVAVLADGSFIAWFALVMWILHLTPTGSPLSSRWRVLAIASTAAMVLWFATSLVWPDPLGPPFESVRSPLALGADVLDPLRIVRDTLGALSGVGFVLGGVSLLVRFHRARGDERRRLLWLAIAVVPLPAFVLLAFYASPDHPLLLSVAIGGFMALVPIAAGLSIARYHLYDVERILSRAVAYLLVSTLLALTFATVVVTAGRFFGDRGDGSSVPAVLGTLAAVLVAAPAYRGFQEAVDRRFDRRRFDALAQVREFAREPEPDTTVEEVLRRALRDPTLEVGYWIEDRRRWLLPDGGVLTPAPDQIEVRRRDRAVARIRFDTDAVDRELARSVWHGGDARDGERDAAGRIRSAGRGTRVPRADRGGPRDRAAADRARPARRRPAATAGAGDGAPGGPAQRRPGPDARRPWRDGAELRGPRCGAARAGERTAPCRAGRRRAGRSVEDLARHSPVPLEARRHRRLVPHPSSGDAWLVVGEAVDERLEARRRATRIEVDVSAVNGELRLRRPRRRPRRRQPGRPRAARAARPGRGCGRHARRPAGPRARRWRRCSRAGRDRRRLRAARDGLTSLLTEAGRRGRGTAADAERALAAVAEHAPDVARGRHPDAADVHARGRQGGARAPRSATRSSASCCCRSRSRAGTSPTSRGPTRAGFGYLLKDRVIDVEVLVDALDAVAAGGTVLDPDVVEPPARPQRARASSSAG